MTSIEGRVVRPQLNYDSFADITTAPLVGIRRDGLDFAGDLTTGQVAAIHDRMTSVDDTDQAARAGLRALLLAIEAPAATFDDLRAALSAFGRYRLGLDLAPPTTDEGA